MKERGILMTGAMVQACLREVDPKGQTRRVFSNRSLDFFRLASRAGECSDFYCSGILHENDPSYILDHCPYGKPGDRLWVKETFGVGRATGNIYYRAESNNSMLGDQPKGHLALFDHWTPSIFMTRAASRLTLEITDVRVQRVQEIGEEDAIAEGIERDSNQRWHDYELRSPRPIGWVNPRPSFRSLWDSINAKPRAVLGEDGKVASYVSYPWEGEAKTVEHRGKPWVIAPNPWVWAISFRRLAS